MRLFCNTNFEPIVESSGGFYSLASVAADVMSLPGPYRMRELIRRWTEFEGMLGTGLLAAVTEPVELLAPIPVPGKILCGQMTFKEGLADAALHKPRLFLKSPQSVVGHGAVVKLPGVDAAIFHHEAELAVVIGQECSDCGPSEAEAAIFGYTGFLDFSARGVGPGTSFEDKSYNGFGPLGPSIVLRDDFHDAGSARIMLTVNGELRHDYTMEDCAFSAGEIVSAASKISTLMPGDIVALGVNHQGLGPIQDGDEVVLCIDQIGTLAVRIFDHRQRRWRRGVDTSAAAAVRQLVSGIPMSAVNLSFSPREDV